MADLPQDAAEGLPEDLLFSGLDTLAEEEFGDFAPDGKEGLGEQVSKHIVQAKKNILPRPRSGKEVRPSSSHARLSVSSEEERFSDCSAFDRKQSSLGRLAQLVGFTTQPLLSCRKGGRSRWTGLGQSLGATSQPCAADAHRRVLSQRCCLLGFRLQVVVFRPCSLLS